jgi:hypothetical protein
VNFNALGVQMMNESEKAFLDFLENEKGVTRKIWPVGQMSKTECEYRYG